MQMFNDLAQRKIFQCAAFFYHGFFVAVWGEDLPQIFTEFFCGGFYHGFSQFFMALSGIILGSMSEKIV